MNHLLFAAVVLLSGFAVTLVDSLPAPNNDGRQTETFTCPPNQYIQGIRSGRVKGHITSVIFECSAPYPQQPLISKQFGPNGEDVHDLRIENGLSDVSVQYSNGWVTGLLVNGMQIARSGDTASRFSGTRATSATVTYNSNRLASINFAFQDVAPVIAPTYKVGPYGGNGGDVDFNFNCPVNSFVTKIEGKFGDWLDSIKVTCNTGETSDRFGGGGGKRAFETNAAEGFTNLDVYFAQRLRGFQVNNGLRGGRDTHQGYMMFRPAPGQKIVGVSGKSAKVIDKLAFHYAKI